MTKILKKSFPLFLITVLTACGLAEPSDPFVEDPDVESPFVKTSNPINFSVLSKNDTSIQLTISEDIDPASLTVLNAIEIKSDTSTLAGTWTYDNNSKILMFTMEDRSALAEEQTFKLNINGEITDLAGNPLVWSLEFDTPPLFDINFTALGLGESESFTVSQTDTSSGKNNTIIIDSNDTKFTIDANLSKSEKYSLVISKAAAKSFCSLSISSGEITNNNIDVTVTCHNVKPLYETASDWNQYYFDDSTSKWLHGGEMRTSQFSTLQSCDNLSATDTLNAFDWVCAEETIDGVTHVNFTSTNLKPNIGLSQLISFTDTPSWKINQISVLQDNQIIAQSGEGIWWANPIISPNSTFLTLKGAVYLAQTSAELNRRYELNADGVSLLIKPGETLRPTSTSAGILVSNRAVGTWIEGDIDASKSQTGIQIQLVSFPTLKYINVRNAENNGIEINDTLLAKISHTQSDNNGGYGINIVSNKVIAGNNIISDSQSTNNTLSGINVTGSDSTLINVTSANNDENGIIVSGNSNYLVNIASNNNRLDGLVIAGATNNIINSATSASNGNAGLSISQQGGLNARNNFVGNLTTTNNLSSGISFDTITVENNNNLINILDAYNAVSECPDTNCDNVTVLSINDISVSDLFTSIASETNINAYEADQVFHIANARTVNTFENSFRAWGNQNPATEDTGGGTCNYDVDGNNGCKLYDWSLNSAETTTALNQLTAVNTQQEHALFESDTLSFLDNAIEIMSDNIGNDNGLCETNENCLLTPNIGGYQGHGDLLKLDEVNDLNATLYQFETNGR